MPTGRCTTPRCRINTLASAVEARLKAKQDARQGAAPTDPVSLLKKSKGHSGERFIARVSRSKFSFCGVESLKNGELTGRKN
jgi:hypothetical protein